MTKLSSWCMNLGVGSVPTLSSSSSSSSSNNPVHSPNPFFATNSNSNAISTSPPQSQRLLNANSRTTTRPTTKNLSIQSPPPPPSVEKSNSNFFNSSSSSSQSQSVNSSISQRPSTSHLSHRIERVKLESGSKSSGDYSGPSLSSGRLIEMERENRGLGFELDLGIEELDFGDLVERRDGDRDRDNEEGVRGRRIETNSPTRSIRTSSLPLHGITGFGERLDRRVTTSQDRSQISNSSLQVEKVGERSYDKNSSITPPTPSKRNRPPPPITIPPPKASKKSSTAIPSSSNSKIEHNSQIVPQSSEESTRKFSNNSLSASSTNFQPKSLQLLKPKPTPHSHSHNIQKYQQHHPYLGTIPLNLTSGGVNIQVETIPSISRRPQSLEVPSSAISSLSEKLSAFVINGLSGGKIIEKNENDVRRGESESEGGGGLRIARVGGTHFSMMSFPRDVTPVTLSENEEEGEEDDNDNDSIESRKSTATFGTFENGGSKKSQSSSSSKKMMMMEIPQLFLESHYSTSSNSHSNPNLLDPLPTISIPTLSRPNSLILPSNSNPLPQLAQSLQASTLTSSNSPSAGSAEQILSEPSSQAMQRSNSNRTLPPAYSSRTGNGGSSTPLKVEAALGELERLKLKDRIELIRTNYKLELNHREKLLARHVACLKGFNGIEGARFAASLVNSISQTDRIAEELQFALETTSSLTYQKSTFQELQQQSELERVKSQRDEALTRLELLERKFSRLELEKKKAGAARSGKAKKPLTPDSDFDDITTTTTRSTLDTATDSKADSSATQVSTIKPMKSSTQLDRIGNSPYNQSNSSVQSKSTPNLSRNEISTSAVQTSSRKITIPIPRRPSLTHLNTSNYSSRTLPLPPLPPPQVPAPSLPSATAISPTRFQFPRTAPTTSKPSSHHPLSNRSFSKSTSPSSFNRAKEEFRSIFDATSISSISSTQNQPRLIRSTSDPISVIPIPLHTNSPSLQGNHHQYSSSTGNLSTRSTTTSTSVSDSEVITSGVENWSGGPRRRGMTSIKFSELDSREIAEMLERME